VLNQADEGAQIQVGGFPAQLLQQFGLLILLGALFQLLEQLLYLLQIEFALRLGL